MLIAVFVIAMLGAQQDTATPVQPTPYTACLNRAVTALEPSGESARVVVQGAFNECEALAPKAEPGTRLAALSPDGQRQVLSELRAMIADDLAVRVMRVRACRNTAGCEATARPAS